VSVVLSQLSQLKISTHPARELASTVLPKLQDEKSVIPQQGSEARNNIHENTMAQGRGPIIAFAVIMIVIIIGAILAPVLVATHKKQVGNGNWSDVLAVGGYVCGHVGAWDVGGGRRV
jgi:hypothetical protein